MTLPLDFQSIIITLQHFWADHGCLIWQPYYTQVGAGTYNPATAFTGCWDLNPGMWLMSSLPCARMMAVTGITPTGCRCIPNSRSFSSPTQAMPRSSILPRWRSWALTRSSMILRFVEDNWESPALGAWGLGWEVWLDGQEITQFTYFQQAGGTFWTPFRWRLPTVLTASPSRCSG